MQVSVQDASEAITTLGENLSKGKGAARAYLKSIDDHTAYSLVSCLRRLGWWLPADRKADQNRLIWWLFRDDVECLFPQNGELVTGIETPLERCSEAIDFVASLRRGIEIPADSCLAVVRIVKVMLSRMTLYFGLPLGGRTRRCGVPKDYDIDDVYLIQFDGECLLASLNLAASKLGLQPGTLTWGSPMSSPLATYRQYSEEVRYLLQGWLTKLEEEIQIRRELPSGWERNEENWPDRPIRSMATLHIWLRSWLDQLYLSRATSRPWWPSPEGYLDCFRRELRNAARALRAWDEPLPSTFDDSPADIHAAEKQINGVMAELSQRITNAPRQLKSDGELSHIFDIGNRERVKAMLVKLDDESKRYVLLAMLELGGTPIGIRLTANVIAKRAVDPLAEAISIRRFMTEFQSLELIQTEKGRGRGSRLTEFGVMVAETLRIQMAQKRHE